MHEFGKLVLNKNPENFHRDVEQAAFSLGSMVPGNEDSPDALLQFRMFFYRDAQYHRLGVNLHEVPVNCPFMAGSYASLNFDKMTRNDANHAGNPQQVPNSFKHKVRPDTAEAPIPSQIISSPARAIIITRASCPTTTRPGSYTPASCRTSSATTYTTIPRASCVL